MVRISATESFRGMAASIPETFAATVPPGPGARPLRNYLEIAGKAGDDRTGQGDPSRAVRTDGAGGSRETG